MGKIKFVTGLICISLLVLVLPTVTNAAETGGISGKVIDKSDMPLPGVTVTTVGIGLIGSRTSTSDENGNFRVPILPVGSYTLTFDMTGYRPLKLEKIAVSLGIETKIKAVMELAQSVKEEIVVVADVVPLVDVKSANVSTYVDKKQLDALPSAREFRDIMKFDPGVTGVRVNTVDGTNKDGMPSVRGEGQYGNNYLIDGLSVRDPDVHSTGTPLNFDAIEEIQIITDGFNPEYGMALGGVVNVVTKSGGNNFSGEFAYIYESDVLSSEESDSIWSTQREYTDVSPYLNLGGPILKDRLWFFLSYNRRDLNETMLDKPVYNNAGDYITTLPGGDAETVENNLFLKLTFQINANNILALAGNYFTSDLSNQGADELRAPEARWDFPTTQDRVRLNYKTIVTESTIFEFKAGIVDRDRTEEPSSGNTDLAQYANIDSTILSHNNDGTDSSIRKRQDALLQGTQYLELGGSHEFKAGIGYYWTDTSRDLNFTGDAEDVFPNDTFDNGTLFKFKNNTVDASWEMVPFNFFEYRPLTVANKSSGFNFFIQDSYSPIENLNIMLGFRMDTQDAKNDADVSIFKFSASDSFSPRLTVTWDINSDAKNIVKAAIGRFYDIASTSLSEWGNTSGGYAYRKFNWFGPTGEEWHNLSEEGRSSALHDPDNWGNTAGETGDPNKPAAEQSGQTNPLSYDKDLKPYYKDEWLLEYNRKIYERYAVKVRYVESHTRDLIDDIAFYDENGEETWLVTNYDRKRRDYTSYEIEFNGRPTDKTLFFLSYVNSAAKGTNPGQFELAGYQDGSGSGNDVGIFGDHLEGEDLYAGLGGVTYGDEGWYGHLPYSVDHQVKLRGSYMAPYGFIIGTSIEWNSGYHWSKRGYNEAYGYSTFPEGRGTRTMPSIIYWDASIEKTFTFSDKYQVGIKADLFNLLNSDTATSYVMEDSDIFGQVLKRQDPFSARLSLSFSF